MTRIRSKSTTSYQVWYIYPDGTEELAKKFKYETPALKYLEVLSLQKDVEGKFELREVPLDVL